MDKETRVWETMVLFVVVALSLVAWVVSGNFPKGDNPLVGPALFPRVLGVILVISSIGVFWQSWRTKATVAVALESTAPFDWLKILRPIGVLGMFALAPLALAQFGLLVTVVAITSGVCFLLSAKWLETLAAAGVMLVFVYLVFILLLKVQT